jgi:hypothetical protein
MLDAGKFYFSFFLGDVLKKYSMNWASTITIKEYLVINVKNVKTPSVFGFYRELPLFPFFFFLGEFLNFIPCVRHLFR